MPHVTFIGNDEQRLVERLQQGDKTAAREFYSRYADTLAGICMRYIADEEDLKDVLQNAFAHIFSHIAEFEYRRAGSLLAWAKRVVVNESLKFLRSREHFEELREDYDVVDESERMPIIQPLGFVLAGFSILVASISHTGPEGNLVPVLRSPLLGVHVLCMMVSYTLLGLTALIGVVGLIKRDAQAMLRDVSLTILYPAVFILTTGTFIGAYWANISWGSYWSWDPKETWALITMLVYSAMLHSSTLSRFNRPRFFHTYAILAILTVLVTYFGVNLLLGGMHSYA